MLSEDLAEVLSEFARTMVTDFPIQRILDHLVKRIVDVLPVTAAGVTLIDQGSTRNMSLPLTRRRCGMRSCRPTWAKGRVSRPTARQAISVPDLHARTASPGSRRGRWNPG